MSDPTDSFCERCGTRYAFAADAPKGPSLKGARVLAKGLKNFVLTDGQSLSDAIESARHDDNREASSRISEAFHRTFNFCMQCRQYACERCWNTEASACLSCAPFADGELFASLPGPHDAAEQPVAAAEWSLFPDEPEPEPEPAPYWATRVAPEAAGVPAYPGAISPTPALSEWEAGPRPEPAAAPAWPAADLIEVAAAAEAQSIGKNGHGPALRQVDQEAANLWPIADQIAPEMALTPGELAIIQAQLGEAEPVEGMPLEFAPEEQAARQVEAEPPAQAEPKVEPPLLSQTPTWWNRRPADDGSEAPAAWSLDDAWARDDEIAGEPSPDTAAAELVRADGAASPDAGEEWAAEQVPDDEASAPSSHLLHRTLTAPVLPPLASMAPQPAAPGPGGLVARLFGRHPADEAAAGSSRGASGNGRPSTDPWPHATRWSERPIVGRRWTLETETPLAETWTAETPILDVAPEYIEARSTAAVAPAAPVAAVKASAGSRATVPSDPAVTSRPDPVTPSAPAAYAAPAVHHANIDPRSAAALRLSAVESAGSHIAPDPGSVETFSPAAPAAYEPARAAAQPADTLIDLPFVEPARRPAPAHEPAWIRVQREAAEAASVQTRDVELVASSAARAASQPAPESPAKPQAVPQASLATPAGTEPAASPQRAAPETPAEPGATAWPPLGASWPSREDRSAPWAAPEAAVVPAAVAATQIPAPTIAEMWVQSSQEVMNRGSVRVCPSCALPVSTQARFCRRCGTPQG